MFFEFICPVVLVLQKSYPLRKDLPLSRNERSKTRALSLSDLSLGSFTNVGFGNLAHSQLNVPSSHKPQHRSLHSTPLLRASKHTYIGVLRNIFSLCPHPIDVIPHTPISFPTSLRGLTSLLYLPSARYSKSVGDPCKLCYKDCR